ncbi:hypothetical protein ACERW7_004673, partial [Escherichia coli]|nr:hypothetical protein [Escherichia coli]
RRIARQPVADFTAPVPGEHHFRDRVQRVVTVRLALPSCCQRSICPTAATRR